MAELDLLDRLEEEDAPSASLPQRAYRLLEELIVTLQLRPGEVLSEIALANRLGIGRTPIREALQRLAREGLIVIIPRRGILVSELDVRRQLRLLELRRELERLNARNSARRASEEERDAFRRIADGMRNAAAQEDDIAFMRFDRALNLLLCRASRNEFVTNAMSLTHGLSRRFWFQHHREVGDLALCATLHADLAAAVAEADEDRAAAASDGLLDYVERFTRATLDAER